jgi:hypothetical protein
MAVKEESMMADLLQVDEATSKVDLLLELDFWNVQLSVLTL